MKQITIGYVSQANPFEDRKAWSGLIFKIRESIENAGFAVKWIPFFLSPWKTKLIKTFTIALHGFSRLPDRTELYFRKLANSIDLKLVDEVDVLFFPEYFQIINYLNTDKPVISYTDANYNIMLDYYIFGVKPWYQKEGNRQEQMAMDRSSITIRASKWAADSVVNDYGGDPDHNYILEFGANIDDDKIFHIEPYSGGRLNVLFSGVEWERKGAQIAIETVELLNKKGVDARLLLCGLSEDKIPIEFRNNKYVEYIGFLNKNYPEQYAKYVETYKRSHIFLLPTKAECAGVVFSEASAYGLPIYTYDTGGIPNYVVNDVNGYRLNLGSSPEMFAEKILETLDADTQRRLHDGGIKHYADEISWKAWSYKFKKIMELEAGNLK